jgi:DNA repair protein RecN (Recombination protein N)
MTVLTGETGAGKTLVVEALSLLLGGRADPGVVRSGADEALVEGRFVTGRGEDATETVLARAVPRNGRSRAWIDGRMATVGSLSEAAGGFIELHGQHQHQALLHPEAQRRTLDLFAGIDLAPLRAARQALTRLTDESSALGGDARQRAREADLLRYQIDEIAAAAIEDPDEDARLEQEEDRLAAASDHRQAAAVALAAIAGGTDGSALDLLATASSALAGRDPLAGADARVRASMAELSDLATELRGVVETWDDDPERLAEVRARRQLFHQLQRKYGDSLDEVLAFAGRARTALDALEGDDQRAMVLDGEIEHARRAMEAVERSVAEARRQAAPRLAAQVEASLHTLAMPSARFTIEVDGPGSADLVTFMLGANPGEPLQPLAKAASGGELARTMLAIRLAITGSAGLLVFDEVDAGVGGAAATAVGAALAALGSRGQVLVVTHLAQVAAQAAHQLAVHKVEEGGRTRSTVTVLDAQARVVELSRMLSGRPDSASARRHARELLGSSNGQGTSATSR